MLSLSSSSSSSPKQSETPNPKPKSQQSKWKSPSQQRIYNRRLVDALRTPHPPNARAVKEAADSALALTARGQSRWSRALLAGRPRRVLLKAAASKLRKPKKPKNFEPKAVEKREDNKVDERLRRLGRLVPGCRKLGAGCLLEEAADYVAALEMQVRTMRALAEALAAAALTEEGEGDSS